MLYDGRIIKYMVMGDINYAPVASQYACANFVGSSSVNGNAGADAIVNVYGHELAEVITDWNFAWYQDGNYELEIGDVCLWDFGVLNNGTKWNIQVGGQKYLVQNIWRPGYGCVHTCC